MKYLLLLLVLLFGGPAWSFPPVHPDTVRLRICRLPAEGLLLSHGWRYHPGDNPAWASPDFDASAWDTLSPGRPRRHLPPALSTGISWLRLRLQLSDSLRQRALLLLTDGNGTFELYLDGQLLTRDGTLNPDGKGAYFA